jgi:hypothetical protein
MRSVKRSAQSLLMLTRLKLRFRRHKATRRSKREAAPEQVQNPAPVADSAFQLKPLRPSLADIR